MLLPGGLEVLGAVAVGEGEGDALRLAVKLREELHPGSQGCIVAVTSSTSSAALEYKWCDGSTTVALDVDEVEGSSVWDESTFLRCQLQLKVPLYLPQTAAASGNSLTVQFVFTFYCMIFLVILVIGLLFRVRGASCWND